MELLQKLLVETEPLRRDFLKKTEEFAMKTYKENQNRVFWRAEEWCNFLGIQPEYEDVKANKNGEITVVRVARFPKGFHNTHNAKTLDNVLKHVIKIKGITDDEFVKLEIENAQKHYQKSIDKLAFRIKEYKLDENKIKLETTYIDQNISTIISDGDKTIKAFTILAWGEIQKPHYRYLIKNK